ncbi:TPA: hypothetical protein EYP37_10320 [Candidatus Poribacteria bacterium]|nr:hypothetical protein [Candidatus Poribacteria bacterium]
MEELALYILDIAQSSIEAGATRIKLSLIEDLPSDKLIIRISDNGGRLRSRHLRPDLKALAAAAEICAGSFQVESKRGLGTTVIATFQHSHVDRSPLGDLPRAIINMIRMLDEGNLIYSHRVVTPKGEEKFELDTSQIREEIGEVPLSHPGVYRWLSEFIGRGEERLARIAQGRDETVVRREP